MKSINEETKYAICYDITNSTKMMITPIDQPFPDNAITSSVFSVFTDENGREYVYDRGLDI